ncbi:hypothetical protein GOBAR_AA06250 [Gossypium barbadense]|uniref:Uncharacterized protein n=1 Tax=Gossypium barbadense TaxID=3634 RepID=A0A2P5YFG4_GOSBA|nr:hypothetical protein GOBAR_AA06250 [Gossypium barbadense]
MPDDSNHNHDTREESHASPMDDTGDEFVQNTDDFDIPIGLGVDEAAYFQNLNFETSIERFRRCKVEDFYGISEDDPIAADGRDGFTARVADVGSILIRVLREVHCRFAFELVASESIKCKRFREGLHIDIYTYLVTNQLEQPRRFRILKDSGELHRHSLKDEVKGQDQGLVEDY